MSTLKYALTFIFAVSLAGLVLFLVQQTNGAYVMVVFGLCVAAFSSYQLRKQNTELSRQKVRRNS